LSEGDGFVTSRGFQLVCEMEFSDPWVSGALTQVEDVDGFFSTRYPAVLWGTERLVGPEGTWTGWYQGFIEHGRGTTYHVMTGDGDYEGLTFIRRMNIRPEDPPTGIGFIYEGVPPPTPGSKVSMSVPETPVSSE
jgi:hypothetical protein